MSNLLPDGRTLSLKAQIGQMIVVRASGYLFDHQIRYPAWEPTTATLQHWLTDLGVGGVILLGGSAAEISLRTEQLQNWADIPLLIAADIEEGVGQRFPGATWFPPPMALGAISVDDPNLAQEYAYQMGAVTAQEAVAIGINWLFAPVVDVNNNPDNPVINIRAFGDQAETVSNLAKAFIQGAQSYSILTTAKHFPGHGDTATDSHLDLPVIPHEISRLETVELPPFQAAIAVGVDSIMSAHLLIQAWDQQYPATLSPDILTGQLRQKLGFSGLIVTDALIMGGVANYASDAELAVMAVIAGVDILLMPKDPEVAIKAIYEAIQQGKISQERIEQSLERIWYAKEKCLQFERSPSLLNQLSQPQAQTTVTAILQASMQTGGSLPVQPISTPNQSRNLIIVDDLLNCDFLDRHAPAVRIPQQLGYKLQLLDQTTLPLVQDDDLPTILQIFVRGNPFRGNAGLTSNAKISYHSMLKGKSIQGLIIYGSPYILDWFRSQLSPPLPWVFSYGQMPLAQRIACEVLFGLSKNLDVISGTFL